MTTNNVLIQLNNASFRYPSQDFLFENVKLTVLQGDKVAIVGANGSGKSTLLKLLTGALPVEDGAQEINCSAYYVPQIDLTIQQKDQKIYEYITEYYEQWWEVLSELERLFNLTLDTELEMHTLSGGELMKLNLVIAIKHNPDVMILDEPTNHLDVKSINTLIEFINNPKNKYTYVMVSHDVFFLDKTVNKIWELENQKITTYGGNYTFYVEQRELHLKGLKKQYELAKEKLERTNELAQKNEEKSARKSEEAKKAYLKGGISKKSYEKGKDASATLQHSKAVAVERLMDEVEEKLEEYETEERRLAFINLKNTKDNANRTIFELKKADLIVAGKKFISDIDLKVTYGDRLVISGNNGAGKTSLVQALASKISKHTANIHSEDFALEGDAYIGDNLSCVYVDQHYSLIKPDLTLIENLMAADPLITKDKAKEQLGKFQFKTEGEFNRLGKDLSGGEMVRLVMAMITAFPIDLVILDEPTNNLDVATVAVLEKSLNNFRGAIIVISHNIEFLNKVNISTAYLIKDNKLKLMPVSPVQKDAFYNALINA